ncbi:bifunctional (p)ppGpp synthetase/guanosine-3',5'-bis(diphosphate) 3'-pyrophosphohydrolase [Flavobacterium sp. ANB]|uniref:HD domain-containing protein n=1 Tax=unclassified Flavobacterium TaxID=196869 RepID=UPI0012B6B972|nr:MULTISPECIES: HD domain-containing protein [unclassified Flavobacterium]MBF4515413.1 bifunctional (p)ppGpp synthetase/guanosine-3',5'-bis(diphosphate) 3'-pyrophosphohydrolase [Flavobacterium sp. ANB]MTD68416.1 HD domain-containing protein [Flavobacterium sp. LC2016-13]
MDVQTIYQKTIIFAASKHLEINQTITDSDLPYVIHLSNVAMEILIASHNTEGFDLNFATQIALLHDTLEDTNTTFEELKLEFGIEIAEGVSALTKNDNLPKEERMLDSLDRISKQKKEIWAVKLADRITNLQKPPKSWDNLKRIKYREEAKIILEKLNGSNQYLENRLRSKIEEYEQYLD